MPGFMILLPLALVALVAAASVAATKTYDDDMRRHGDWDGER